MPHDGHYEQVMDRIKNAEPGGTRIYFGYSSVLDVDAFNIWKHEHGYGHFSLPEGIPATLPNYALDFNCGSRWWGGRIPGLVEKPGASVKGIAFTIRNEDWPIIQHKEGHVTNLSIEIPVTIDLNGEKVAATAFTTHPSRISHDGPISEGYLEAWQKGARASGLDEGYIQGVVSKN